MRTVLAAVASVFLMSGAAFAADISYGKYSYEEFKCVAKAVWYEGGSSGQNKEEQKLGAHTMLMRKKKVLDDPYLKKDWGGPDLCSIIKHPKQYSYHSFRYSRILPVKGDLWVRAQCVLPIVGKFTACQWWETTKDAVHEVMVGWSDGTYLPPVGLEQADSYIMRGCADRGGPEAEKCLERFRVSDRSRCYFRIALVELSHDGFPEQRIHSYFRKKTIDEVLQTINDVPAICKGARRTVEIMYMSHLHWVVSHGRLAELPPRQPVEPSFFVDPPKPAKKAKIKSRAGKGKKEYRSLRKGKQKPTLKKRVKK